MKVRELLNSKHLMNKTIKEVDYHFHLLCREIKDLEMLFPSIKGKSEDELVYFFLDIFDRCNSSSNNYDSNLDMEVTRFCLKTDKFGGNHEMDTFEDDYDFGRKNSDIYDDYIDSQSGMMR